MDIQSDIKLTDMFGLLFNNYVNEYKIQENMAAIKYYSGMTVSDMEINEKIINLESSVIFKNHIYRQDVMQEAYEPFLSWIYEIFHRYYDISAEEFLNNAGVYPLMIPMFRNYLELGKFGRLDQRIVSEGVYERSRLLEAIINIFKLYFTGTQAACRYSKNTLCRILRAGLIIIHDKSQTSKQYHGGHYL